MDKDNLFPKNSGRMDLEETDKVLKELLQNARELEDEKYISAFQDAIGAVRGLINFMRFAEDIEEATVDVVGKKKYAEIQKRLAKKVLEDMMEVLDDEDEKTEIGTLGMLMLDSDKDFAEMLIKMAYFTTVVFEGK